MERTKFVEAQIEKAQEMIKSRDNQFSNLYRQVNENKKNIRKCIEMLKEIKEK